MIAPVSLSGSNGRKTKLENYGTSMGITGKPKVSSVKICETFCFEEDIDEVLDELLLVKGVTRDIFDKVKDRVTVYGTGQVNINTAGMRVLQSLGMSEELAEKIRGRIRGKLESVLDS